MHATRIYLNKMDNNKARVKVDFKITFNSIKRDKMLSAVILEILPFLSYSSPSFLVWVNK